MSVKFGLAALEFDKAPGVEGSGSHHPGSVKAKVPTIRLFIFTSDSILPYHLNLNLVEFFHEGPLSSKAL